MHRVNSNQQRAVVLRITAYSVTLILTALTTVLLLYIALGYRFDRAGHVTRSGLLLVDSHAEAAGVYINNQQKDTATPSRFVLPAGSYSLALKLKGYRDWSKQVQIAASGVREVDYPLLVPAKLNTRRLISFDMPEFVTQSQDRKLLLTHVTNASQMELIELDPKAPKQTPLTLPNTVRRENGQYGSFTVVEWALNNKKVLLQQTLPSGAVDLISLDVTKPDEAINISTLYGTSAPTDIHYVGGNTDQVYGIKGGILSRYSLKTSDSTTLLQNIRSYQPYSDNTILFDRLAAQDAEIGILQNDIATVIQRGVATNAPTILKYANYQDHFYFAIASPSGNTLTIYRDPLKKPVLAKQLPLKTIVFPGLQKMDFSDSSQFIMVQNGKNFLTYDLDDLLAFKMTVPFELATGAKLVWADSSHLQVQAADGNVYLMEYDGLNQQTLVSSRAGTKLFFANNYQHFYQLSDDQGAQSKLSGVSMVAGKD